MPAPALTWRKSRRLTESWSMRPPIILFFYLDVMGPLSLITSTTSNWSARTANSSEQLPNLVMSFSMSVMSALRQKQTYRPINPCAMNVETPAFLGARWGLYGGGKWRRRSSSRTE